MDNNPEQKIPLGKLFQVLPSIDTPIKLIGYSIASIVIVVALSFSYPDLTITGISIGAIVIIMALYSFFIHNRYTKTSKEILEETEVSEKKNLLKDISTDRFQMLLKGVEFNKDYIEKNEIYDLYIACPMDSFPPEQRDKASDHLSKLVQILKGEYSFDRIECPASIQTNTDPTKPVKKYDPPKQAFMLCYSRILLSRRFILIYPFEVATSAIMEIGLAISFGKPITVFTKNRNELPFLLREMDELPMPHTIHEFNGEIEDIVDRISKKTIKIQA